MSDLLKKTSDLLICSFVLIDWANRSQSLIWSEQAEQQSKWANERMSKWENERISDEQMSYERIPNPALGQSGDAIQIYILVDSLLSTNPSPSSG